MGTMAATLAHELNQPLAAVESYIGAARNLLPRDGDHASGEMERALAGASSQALRAAAIIKRTREMLARRDIEFGHEDVAALLAEAKELACLGHADHAIAIEMAIEPELGSVLVDRIQIQQVVLNLLRNAFDAVCGAPVRQIRVEAVARDHGIAEITVSDTGCGLSPDDRENVFDAFFGTKVGGLGVGLSICRTIVEVHGGRIWAAPRAGGGTEFHFTLRRSKRGEGGCKRLERFMSSTTIERSAMPLE
jgi:two-component system sensor kinase FixL